MFASFNGVFPSSVCRLVESGDPHVWASDGSVSFYFGGREELPEWSVKVRARHSSLLIHQNKCTNCVVVSFLAERVTLDLTAPLSSSRRILRCDPPFPSMIGHTAQDLLKKLLVKDPHKRLGSGPRGAEDIKAHPFFKVFISQTSHSSVSSVRSFHIHQLSPPAPCSHTGAELGWPSAEEGAQSF